VFKREFLQRYHIVLNVGLLPMKCISVVITSACPVQCPFIVDLPGDLPGAAAPVPEDP